MNTDPLEVRRLLRRHMSKRHPHQNVVTRLLLRRMTLHTLVWVHQSEHDHFGPVIGHADDDFTDVTKPDA